MAFISALSSAQAPFAYTQESLYDFAQALEEGPQNGLEAMYKRSGIATRRSVLPDFGPDGTPKNLYPQDLAAPFPDVRERMQLFQKEALPLALQSLPAMDRPPTHLIAVSCTGMAAPGLDLALMKALELPPATQRTCVHFMGCYAALHALKQAAAICQAQPGQRVLVVAVELCSLHFQKPKSMDQRTANLLFADGAASAVVTSEAPSEGPYFQIRNFASRVLPEGERDMAWEIGPEAFLMRLSAYVPALLEKELESPIQELFAANNPQEALAWAVHPGGRKILDKVGKVFGLGNDQLASSYGVLRDFGNMSSPTVLYILERILKNRQESGLVPTMAFGPGLTLEAALLELCHA